MIRESLGGVPYNVRRLRNNRGGRIQSLLAFLTLAFCALLMPSWAFADAPPAGAVIGNQATASYTDAGGNNRSTTSNLVVTSIQQVAGVDVQSDLTKTAAPGTTVYLPHTVKNTGNGPDSYDLLVSQLGGGGYNFTGPILIYADPNGDGVPDGSPITSTDVIAAGQTKNYVIAAQVPTTATSGQTSQLTVKATSKFDSSISDFNTDTVKVTQNAVVPVTKALSVTSGPAGTSNVTITLTYTNNGSNTAKNVTLTDNLDARYTYVDASGRWNGGTTALTDAVDGNEAGANSGIEYSRVGQLVTAKIAQVLPGQSGFVKFVVNVKGDASGTIPNTAINNYDDGSGTIINEPSNPAPFTVTPTAGVQLSDTNSNTSTPNDGRDTDGPNDVVLRPAVPQGSTVYFDNVVKNNGTANDTFDVTYDASTFPTGTSFQLLRADGTPMTDSTGNGVLDTGPVAPGAEFHVILKAILPSDATGGGPYNVTKKATSVADPSKSDTVTDRLAGITGNTVDMTNDASLATNPNAPGKGVTTNGEAAPVTTRAVNPGQTAKFDLWINNTSTVSDSYNLLASTDNSFAAVALPAGWSVVFRNKLTNAVISNTGSIAAGGNLEVTAEVTVPTTQKPITQSIFFRALSPTSGAKDVKNDAVTVNDVTDVSIAPNNVGQIFAGGIIEYKHTLSNNGNTDVLSGPITMGNSATNGWTSSIWYDANNNGTVDAGDIELTDISVLPSKLPVGASVPVVVKVFAPSGAVDGTANVTTITVKAPGDTNASNDVATDTTTVQPGNVQLTKTQAPDRDCNGTAESGFVSTELSAKPGECLIYKVTLTNLGTQPVSNAVISDTTPSFTTYVANSASVTPAGTPTAPAGGSAGTVSGTVTGSVASGGSAALTFAVKIAQ